MCSVPDFGAGGFLLSVSEAACCLSNKVDGNDVDTGRRREKGSRLALCANPGVAANLQVRSDWSEVNNRKSKQEEKRQQPQSIIVIRYRPSRPALACFLPTALRYYNVYSDACIESSHERR